MKRHFATLLLPLFSGAIVAGCIADPPLKIATRYEPVVRNDGWITATPVEEGIDPAAIDRAYAMFFDQEKYRNAISLLVVRHGRLVAEGYCHDRRDIDVKRNIKSCTKSVTSMLLGIAMREGLVDSLDRPLAAFMPEAFEGESQAKRSITLRQALTMRTGLPYNNDRDNEELLVDRPASSLRYVLKGDLDFSPGTRFHYSDSPPHLVGGVIQKRAGESLGRYAASRLFAAVGITDVIWEEHPDGLSYGAFGIYMKPRDLAKLGQLALQQGEWNGTSVVPREWMEESTRGVANNGGYGYYWWVRPDFGAYTMAGHGGTYVYAIPSRQLLIVMTAMPFIDGKHQIPMDEFENIAAVILDGTTP